MTYIQFHIVARFTVILILCQIIRHQCLTSSKFNHAIAAVLKFFGFIRRHSMPSVLMDKCSTVAEMDDCLATMDMGRKEGAALPLSGRGLGFHLTRCGQGRSLLQYLHLDPSRRLATTDMGLKFFLLGGGQLGPHLTQSSKLRPTSVPSGILIHPAVRP